MVSPARKREAVVHLKGKFQVSQRRACKSLVQPRSTERYVSLRLGKDAVLAAQLRQFSASQPRAGYRMAHQHLRREGGQANLKRVQHVWRQEGLRVPRKQTKKQSLGSTEAGSQRQRATQINKVWCYDFVFDQTEDGRRLKWLPVCDEFTRESVAGGLQSPTVELFVRLSDPGGVRAAMPSGRLRSVSQKALRVPETKTRPSTQTQTQTKKLNRQLAQDSHKNWLKPRWHYTMDLLKSASLHWRSIGLATWW